jgi:hypothetical protein
MQVDEHSFQVRLQAEEANGDAQGPEMVSWFVTGPCTGQDWELTITDDSNDVDHSDR